MDSVPPLGGLVAGRKIRWRLLTPLTLILLGIVGMVLSYQLGLGSMMVPQPGFWPFVTFSAVAVTAILIIPKDRAGDYDRWDRRTLRVFAGIGVLVGFVVLFEPVGFLIPATLLAVAWIRFFGREPWSTSLICATTGCVALFVLFDLVLGVPFPEGPEATLLDQIGV